MTEPAWMRDVLDAVNPPLYVIAVPEQSSKGLPFMVEFLGVGEWPCAESESEETA